MGNPWPHTGDPTWPTDGPAIVAYLYLYILYVFIVCLLFGYRFYLILDYYFSRRLSVYKEGRYATLTAQSAVDVVWRVSSSQSAQFNSTIQLNSIRRFNSIRLCVPPAVSVTRQNNLRSAYSLSRWIELNLIDRRETNRRIESKRRTELIESNWLVESKGNW